MVIFEIIICQWGNFFIFKEISSFFEKNDDLFCFILILLYLCDSF